MNRRIEEANKWLEARRKWERKGIRLMFVVVAVQWAITLPSLFFNYSTYTVIHVNALFVVLIMLIVVINIPDAGKVHKRLIEQASP